MANDKEQLQTEREIATAIVSEVCLAAINARLPGDALEWDAGTKDNPQKRSIAKAKIIALFRWMVEQAGDFNRPLTFEFQKGGAAVMGGFLSETFHGDNRAGGILCRMHKAGVRVPCISTGGCFIRFRTLNDADDDQGGFTICIRDEEVSTRTTFLLRNIPLG